MNDDVSALNRQGITLAQTGQLAEAAACFQEVLRLEPNSGHVYNNLANVYLFEGRYEEAIANYNHAVNLLPNDAGIYSHLSYAYSKCDNGPEAEACARQALSLRPQFPDALNHLGIALGMQGNYADAEASYRAALALKPDLANALGNLAQLYFLERRFDDALETAHQAVRADASHGQAHATLAAIYIRRREYDAALASCQEALRRNPLLNEAHYNLATIYMETGRLDQARAAAEDFLRVRPNYIYMHTVLGTIALRENRLDDALAHYSTVLGLRPDEALVHFNRAVVWLLQGNFADGWPEYEWRWRWKDFVTRPFPKPIWDGGPLAGKTILLHAEQGLGDTIQFIRYAPLVKERGGTVIVACQEPLLGLLSRCPGVDQLVAQETYAPAVGEHAPLLSLPHLFKTTPATIPVTVPYVFADPKLVKTWQSTLEEYPGLKVGVAWQGSKQHPEDTGRSIALAQFEPLARASGVHLISLQKGDGQEQIAGAPFRVIEPCCDHADAFMDIAAVIMNLDLVITCDTAIAHLAGALGAPVWVALKFNPDFRWLLERADTPWYPTMRLYRQRRRGDWDPVFAQMAKDLSNFPEHTP